MPLPSVTSAPRSAAKDRHRRMVEYSIMMGTRILCVLAMFLVPGWWRLLPAAGAIFLPYFAVIIANVSTRTSEDPTTVTPRQLPPGQPRP